MQKIKNNLRVLRAERDMTQDDLAVVTGVTRQTINHIENNLYIPSLGLAFAISRIFNKDVEDVFIYNKKIKEPKKCE